MFTVPICGEAINTANIGITTTITSGNISCTNISGTNATFNQLSTTTFNPQNLNTSNVNTQNLNVVNTIPLLNVSVLNASQKNVSNMSVENLSVGTITADNISTAALIPGTNINISNNIISAVNDALLPANANFSSVNSCSLSVTGTTILGGTSYVSDSLIVTNAVNCSSITANNLSTGDMEIVSPLTYNSGTKQLSCEVLTTPVSGSTLPVSSGALYNVLGNISEQASLIHTSLYRSGLTNYDVTIANTYLGPGVSGYLFYVDYHPKYEDSLIKVNAYFSYDVGGAAADSAEFQLIIGRASNTITRTDQIIYQKWTNAGGGGTRSGSASAIGGVYPQEDSLSTGLFHRIHVYYNNNTNDSLTLTDSGNYISMEVTETLDTQTSYNNNIRIGTGNISANNMSLTGSLSVNPGSGTGTPVKIGRTTIGNASLSNMLSLGVDNNTTGTNYGFGQVANNETIMNAMSATTHNSFRVENVETMRNTSVGLGIKTLSNPTNALEVNGTISCTNFEPNTLNASVINVSTLDVEDATMGNVSVENLDVSILGLLSSYNSSFDRAYINNISTTNISVTGNISCVGNITATNLSTASLSANSNISILNGSISAYLEGGIDWNASSIHVDNDVNIFGNLNVSETSTFEQSLNIENQLFVGKAGELDGQVVLYSNTLGENLVISNNGDSTASITGAGTTNEFNISLGGNEIVEVFNDTVNIHGLLNVSTIAINGSTDIIGLKTNEINISDTTNVSQYTRIHRQGDQTFFVGNNFNQGCDYKFYTGTDSQTLALEINRSLTTTINRLEVVNTMESVNICTDNNISCGGSLSVVGNISTDNNISCGGSLSCVGNINASEINTSSLVASELAGFKNMSIVGDVEIMILGSLTSYNNSFDNIHSRSINCSDSLVCHGNVSIDASGNISCMDINCEGVDVINFSAHIGFIDNLYIEAINSKSLIAMGYTPTGIASESLILMASGGTGDGTVEIENGSTDFNISSRGSGKTYRFSNATIPLLEITDTNTSCQNLVVNGDINSSGNVNISGTLTADSISGIDLANICSTNISTTNLSVTNGTFSQISFPITAPYLYFNPLDYTLNVSVKAIEDEIFTGNINISSLNASIVRTEDIIYNGALFTSGTIDWRSFGCKIDTFILNASTSNASFASAINASVSNDLDVDGILDCFDLVADTGSIGVLDVTGNLNVSGFAYFEENGIFFDNIIIYGDFLALGDTNGGSNSELYIYSNTAGDNMIMGHANASEFRFKLSNVAESMNFVIGNSSILVLDSSEARFHKNVNLSYTLSATVLEADDANIELVNASNMSADVAEISTLNGDFFSVSTLVADDFVNTQEMRTPLINVSTINASIINSSNLSTGSILFSSDFQFSLNTLSLIPSETSAAIQSATLATIATQVDSATGNFSSINADFGTIGGGLNANTLNASIVNYSSADGINLSATNISATSITAPDVQPTLTAGTNITIVGNTISATGGSSFDPTNISNTNLSSTNITTTNLSATNISLTGSLSVNPGSGTGTPVKIGRTTIGNTSFDNMLSLGVDDNTTGSNYNFGAIVDDQTIMNITNSTTHNSFRAQNVEVMRNTSVGLGIKTLSNPTNALEVNGTIDTSNISSINCSFTNVTATLINNHQNYMRYVSTGSTSLTSSQTFYDLQFGGNDSNGYKPNTSLITTNTGRSIYTIVKAGYYRFFCQVGCFNDTYGNRVVYRLRPIVNGGSSNAYSQTFCYTRHNQYGNRGTVSAEIIRNMAIGDTVSFRLDCGKGSFNSTFGSEMSGLQAVGGRYVEAQFLGEN